MAVEEEVKELKPVVDRYKLFSYMENIVVSVEGWSSLEVIKEYLLKKFRCKDDIDMLKNPRAMFMKSEAYLAAEDNEEREKLLKDMAEFNLGDVVTSYYVP